MANTFVNNGLGTWNLTDGNGDALTGRIFNTQSMGALNNLMGGLAGEGVNYALTGSATFNIANLSMLGIQGKDGLISHGLLELRVGKNGAGMALGSGGTDTSLGNIANAIQGIQESYRIGKAKLGGIESVSTLNAVNMLGWTGSDYEIDLGRSIWGGKLGVEYGDLTGQYGSYTSGDGKIRLSNSLLGGGREGSAKLATVMSHEGTHVLENRIEGLAHVQGWNTYEALKSKFGLEGDKEFSGQMLAAIMDEESWKENTGSTDNWKLIKREDGTYGIEYDKNHSLVGEDGKILIKSILDKFDKDGNIVGHEFETNNSYFRSFGMLMGLYPNFNNDSLKSYNEYYENKSKVRGGKIEVNTLGQDAEMRKSIAGLLKGAGFTVSEKDGISNPADGRGYPANSFIMTYKNIVENGGMFRDADDSSSFYDSFVNIPILNNRNEIAGYVSTLFSGRWDDIDLAIVENMIPEGGRLRAGTFQITPYGEVSLFGLGSSMPDPTKMSKEHPALVDGKYGYSMSVHNPTKAEGYPALRLYSEYVENLRLVNGPVHENILKQYSGLSNQETFNWGNEAYRNFVGYYYDAKGNRVGGNTNAINGHNSTKYPHIATKTDNYLGGSLGCQIYQPKTFDYLTKILQNSNTMQTKGYFYVRRDIFGDGTNNKNNWWQP